jgi:hypothetical protein
MDSKLKITLHGIISLKLLTRDLKTRNKSGEERVLLRKIQG